MARLVVDGVACEIPSDDRPLLAVLREDLGVTAPKYGCGEGRCGACAVLVDGVPTLACVHPAKDVAGAVTTASGLAADGLTALQRAFAEHGAFQCGYCTPGMLVAATALLATNPHPSDDEIVAAMDGHVCQCGAYPRILRAIRAAADGNVGEEPPKAPVAPTLSPAATGGRAPWDLTKPADRGMFEALGPGAIVVVPPSPTSWGPPKGGAWVHVAPDGAVTAFTGKVDVGQVNRTGLSAIVAEELGVEIGRVALVMGDTDVCPFDVGTFGSRSTPDAGSDLRKAAARMRAVLAREPLDGGSRILETGAGAASEDAGGHSSTPGTGSPSAATRRPLVAASVSLAAPATVGPRSHPEVAASVSLAAPATHARSQRVGRREVVAAEKTFPTDLSLPGMLHARVLRPPALGAVLRSADTSAARAMPGVVVVEAGGVAVAAPTEQAADAALAAVRADWDVTPQPSEADLEGWLRSHPVDRLGWETAVDDVQGDPDAAIASADVRVEATYTTAYIAHVPIEPRCVLAAWSGDRVTVWTGSQRPFGVRQEVADALGIGQDRVRVVVPDTGDGFGGKHAGVAAADAARLAKAAGRPVKLRWTREEEFTWGYFRPAAVIDVRAGVRGGRLVGWSQATVNAGAAALFTPYDVAAREHRFQPAASPLAQGPYRSLAAAANHFARESAMDELAAQIGQDPLAFRLAHLRDDRLADVFRAAAERAGWGSPRSEADGGRRPTDGGPTAHSSALRGRGMAGGIEKGGRVATVAEVTVDGGRVRVDRLVTAFECGRIVDPDAVAAQIEGAAVMGLGGALFEAVHFADGRILNPHLSQYRVPRFSDLPVIEAVLVDRPDQPSAGAGETPIVGIAPAIANAIFAACGVRLRRLPLAPDGLVHGL